MLLTIYRILTILLLPVIHLYLWRRRQRGKEDPLRYRERVGYASRPRSEGRLVWVHAASVGESLSVLPLVEKLLAAYPDIHVLVTTGTVTSATLLEKRLSARAFHQYVPVDTWFAVRRFLAHWKPDVALWVESELWPNLITGTHATGCAVALLNARMSERSFRAWRRVPIFARTLLQSFHFVFPQSEEAVARFTQLGARNVSYLGNLKSDAPLLPANDAEVVQLSAAIGERLVWLAASTHPGEEEQLAAVHRHLKEKFPTLLTILVPRHAARGDAVAHLLRAYALHVAQRSKREPILPTTDLYLADTMGELGLFYRLSPIAFMGGSLVNHGGQNPLEAARLGCAILYGPAMFNFAEVCTALERQQASLRVSDAEALAEAVERLLADPAMQKTLAQAAQTMAESARGVTDAVLTALAPLFTEVA
ncbi:MAG: 3-deoxy-D-manno-octulosonic acid transferase [Alphaproteobacteria bacterium]|nr:3-deoxy-D-manno-octulosonic acid transferase [Alphaproteobacteria bacterium]